MTNEITKPQKCVVLRNGLEIWVDKNQAEKIEEDWIRGTLKGPAKIEGRVLNTADITAIINPADMVDWRHRKNGEWKCHSGTWHIRGEKCECASAEEKEFARRREAAVKDCGKCDNGWIWTAPRSAVSGLNGGTMRQCKCVIKLR